jgi:hypothetical protein
LNAALRIRHPNRRARPIVRDRSLRLLERERVLIADSLV